MPTLGFCICDIQRRSDGVPDVGTALTGVLLDTEHPTGKASLPCLSSLYCTVQAPKQHWRHAWEKPTKSAVRQLRNHKPKNPTHTPRQQASTHIHTLTSHQFTLSSPDRSTTASSTPFSEALPLTQPRQTHPSCTQTCLGPSPFYASLPDEVSAHWRNVHPCHFHRRFVHRLHIDQCAKENLSASEIAIAAHSSKTISFRLSLSANLRTLIPERVTHASNRGPVMSFLSLLGFVDDARRL